MNFHNPSEVIQTMCRVTHDAHDIKIEVENETIIIKALEKHNHNFQMRWTYEGYGNERVREISKEYSRFLMARQHNQDSLTDEG